LGAIELSTGDLARGAGAVGGAAPDEGAAPAYRRDFGLLFSGQFVSRLGDKLALVAFPVLVYGSTDSAFSTGVVLALFTLPYVLFGVLAGAVIDRSRKRTLMISIDLIRAALVLAVPFVAPHSLAAVYGLAFVIASASVFFEPCLLAFVPEIVPEGKLLRANSILSTGDNLTEILGYLLAGAVIFSLSIKSVLVIDAGTFFVSAAALALMGAGRVRAKRDAADGSGRIRATGGAADGAGRIRATGGAADGGGQAEPDDGAARPRLGHEIAEGLRFLAGHAGLRANTLLTVTVIAGVGASYPLSFLLAVEQFGGAWSFTLMEAAIAVGYLAGSIGLAIVARRVRKGLVITVGMALVGAGFALIASLTSLTAVIIVFALTGVANAVLLIAIDTYLQEAIPAGLRGRVLGTRFTITQGVYALGVLSAGALAVVVDLDWLFLCVGLIVALPALAGMFWPAVRDA
jgi:MFS family permease